MKEKIQLLLIMFGLVALLAITPVVFKNNPIENKFPPPIETLVVDREEHHDKKLEWIEQMHRSAPEDNWRLMDMNFRLNNASNKLGAPNNRNEVLYGKWKELGSNNQAGRTLVSDYDAETDEIYLASDGGQIWKGQIGMDNWQSLTDHIKIPAIHFLRRIEHNGGYRFIVGSGRWNIPGLLYSDDDCQTWQVTTGLENMESWGYVRRVIMKNDPSEGIYVLCQEWDYTNWNAMSQIYVSHDFGESFSPLTSFPFGADIVDLWTNPYGNDEVYVLAKDEFFTLDDLGNLTLIGQLPSEAPEKLILTGASTLGAPQLYALMRYNGNSNFFASTHGGSDWALKSSKNEGPFMINSFVASPTQLGLVYFGGINASYSADHGNTWTLVNEWYHYYNSPEDKLHADIPSFAPFIDAEGNEFILINTDGGIYISYDYLENVSNLSMNNLRISQYYSTYTCRFAPDYTHAGAQDQGYQFSNQNADTSVINYEQLISGDYGHIVSGDEGASVWMDYPGFVMYGPDINNSTALKTWDFVGQNYQWIPRLMADPNNPASVYVAGGSVTTGAHLIHVSYHSGQMSYQEEPFDFSNGTDANISALAYSPVNTDYRYVMTTEGSFFYSANAGSSWIETEGFTGPGSHYFYGASIVTSNNNPDLVYVGGSGYSNPGVYKSDRNGITFEAFDSGLPETLIFNMALSPDDSLLFAATELGAFVCKTWEGQWYELGDSNLPDQAWWSVDYVESLDKVRFASYGRGVWEFDLDPSVEADFLADKVEIQAGDTINFTDLSLWNPQSWEWDFENDGTIDSYVQNPVWIFTDPGTYTVSLTISNAKDEDTETKVDYITVSQTGSQELILPKGWSGISSYVIPDDPDVETIFESVVEEMIILQNFAGMYWPTAGVNTLNNWNDHAGYQVKMETVQQVIFSGSMQDNLTVNLSEGWNYLPVLNACNTDVEILFSGIIDHIQIVKEVAGTGVYWPQFGVNTLEELVPGKAYFVLVDEDVEVEFAECENSSNSQRTPSNSHLRGRTGQRAGAPSPSGEGWGEVIKTPITHTIAIPQQVLSGIDGNIITIYNQAGLCCGAIPIQNQNLVLTAFGDDPTTSQVDGMISGEALQFRVYNPETGKEYPLDFEFDKQMPQGGYFVNHGLSAVKELEITGINEIADLQLNISVYPNPSAGVFHISTLTVPHMRDKTLSEFDWEITDTHGSVVASGNDEIHEFTIDISKHPTGIYYLKITQGGLQSVKKLVLQYD